MINNDIAIIFDMNGVIVDDEKYQKMAWIKFCQQNNIKTKNMKDIILGKTTTEILKLLFHNQLKNSLIEKYAHERTSIAKQLFTPYLKHMEGLSQFLEILKKDNLKSAIATSSSVDYINFILDGIGLRDYFTSITNGDEITKCKPNPEIYLLAAQKLDCMPYRCVVFEDSLSGIQSAKSAGMKVISLTTSYTATELKKHTHIVISTFNDIKLEQLKKLFD